MESINDQRTSLRFAKIKFDPVNQQNGLLSLRDFKKGATISHFAAAETLPHPSRYTVQVGDDKHIILSPLLLEYINHSCSPNCFFDTTNFVLRALSDIQAGEEFCFFYPSTEWSMEEAFDCHCGSSECLGFIQGAQYLPEEIMSRHQFTDFIRRKLQKEHQHVFGI